MRERNVPFAVVLIYSRSKERSNNAMTSARVGNDGCAPTFVAAAAPAAHAKFNASSGD
jgi:hypothetical protein